MPQALSNPQKRYLRGLAHDLKPVVMVGAKGVTLGVRSELALALEQHELVKVKVAAADRDSRDALIADLADSCDAVLVSRLGHTAVLYRRNDENPLVILPRG